VAAGAIAAALVLVFVLMLVLASERAGEPVEAPAGTPSESPSDPAGRQGTPLPPVLLVRRIGELPAPVLRRARELAGRDRVSVGSSRRVGLVRSRTRVRETVDRPRPGFVIPLELAAVEPRSYAPLLPVSARKAVRALGRGEALLGATSARVRRVRPGDRLELTGGRSLRVAGVVDDETVRRAELIVNAQEGTRLGARPSWALVPYSGEPGRLARELNEVGGPELRVRDLGRAPWPSFLAILPQATLKERFGEFAVRASGDKRSIVVDPAWVRRNIVSSRVPILGSVSCHRAMIGPLRRALGELRRRGLARVVDPDDYAGCYAAKDIPTTGGVSRHAWGLAIDLNAAANPYGEPPRQDRRLVEVMERNGFAWGGHWPTPDAMHFEYVGEGTGAGA
jgi:hypothetical protein